MCDNKPSLASHITVKTIIKSQVALEICLLLSMQHKNQLSKTSKRQTPIVKVNIPDCCQTHRFRPQRQNGVKSRGGEA